LRILWCSQSGSDSKNNLAKFGHILDMKVGKNKIKIFLYSWLPTGTYHKNLAIWNFFSSKSGEFRSFFPWKIFCIGQNHIFQVEIWWKFVSKRNNDPNICFGTLTSMAALQNWKQKTGTQQWFISQNLWIFDRLDFFVFCPSHICFNIQRPQKNLFKTYLTLFIVTCISKISYKNYWNNLEFQN
jgi:hypothetical protein